LAASPINARLHSISFEKIAKAFLNKTNERLKIRDFPYCPNLRALLAPRIPLCKLKRRFTREEPKQ
jgi:hypothetical protein